MKTVLQFIWDLKLHKADEEVLIAHVERAQEHSSGPGLADECTSTVRHFLKANPPKRGPCGMSWRGYVQVEDALNQGFTSKQAYKMAIPAIGIVAVLVANVTFVAWVTPPGGESPAWAGCDYPLFTAFLMLNGVAFVLSVASTVVVTAFPLVLSKTPHQAVTWGGILLILSMVSFIAAFLMAGYVTVGYLAPPPSCSNLRCTQGGIACKFAVLPWSSNTSGGVVGDLHVGNDITGDNGDVVSTVFGMDFNVAGLNAIADATSIGVCVTYNRSISYGSYSTLLPWAPPFTYPITHPETTDAITRLYEDLQLQLQTVCLNRADMPLAIDPDIDRVTLAVNISGDIPDLPSYMAINQLSLFSMLPRANFEKLWPYSGFLYSCLPRSVDSRMQFDVLCEQSWKMVGPDAGNLSVSKTGEYIKVATASDSDATVFDVNITAQQVSPAVHALVGVFTCTCFIIAVFLLRSKVKQ